MRYPKNSPRSDSNPDTNSRRKSLARRLATGLLVPTSTALLLGFLGSPGHGQNVQEETQKLIATDGAGRFDSFGVALDISDNVALVGSVDDELHRDSGAVYAYRSDGNSFSLEQKLKASDADPNDIFGVSVAVDGDVAVIGAWGDEDNGLLSGSAYIFRYDGTTWVEEQKLLASDGEAQDRFGENVEILGDVVLVAARFDDAVYVFRFDGLAWVEEQKLLAPPGSGRFGVSLALDGDVAIVGDDIGNSGTGSAHVYRFNGTAFVEEQTLLASDGAAQDYFGTSVSISGNTIIVGSYRHDNGDVDTGAAYIYRFDGASFVEDQKLLAADGAPGDKFGVSVALAGDRAVVGAYTSDQGPASGAAYVYRLQEGSFVEERKLLASDGAAADLLGSNVALSGDTAIVAATGDDDRGSGSGSAYLFTGLSSNLVEARQGTVNAGAGAIADVLTINGSAGSESRTVNVGLGEGFTIQLDAAPAGPAQSLYVFYVWVGSPSNQAFTLSNAGQTIGSFVNATPLHRNAGPQPFRALKSPALPALLTQGVTEVNGSATAPFALPVNNGLLTGGRFVFQGLIQDDAAGNDTGFSTTNAVSLIIE